MQSGVATEPSAKQLEEQLWLSPSLADASLAQLSAWCHYHYHQHSNKQQQEQGNKGKVCKQKQKRRDSGRTRLGSRTRSPELSSSSSSSSKVGTAKITSASSWSELKVLPDHEQVAVAGGQAAVAAHLWRLAQVNTYKTPTELQMEDVCAATLLVKSLLPMFGLQEGEEEPLLGDVRLSRRPAATLCFAADIARGCLQRDLFRRSSSRERRKCT
jgi:hypothetical protein